VRIVDSLEEAPLHVLEGVFFERRRGVGDVATTLVDRE